MPILLILSFLAPGLILIYPLISFLRYVFFKKAVNKSDRYIIPVSIIIACYNEEKYIRNKILSFLDNDEWIIGSEIIIVSAGSSDNTNSILSEFETNPSIRIIYNQTQISKITAVNLAVDYAKKEILVFSDCRQTMKKGSLKHLVSNFNDIEVGTVVAVLQDPDKLQEQSFLRKTINTLVYYDSQSGSGLNVYGALYAQRKTLFQKFPQTQLFEDLCVIVSTISQGKRLIQEPLAIIYDVNFQQYYGKERLERLTRGLMLFITKQWGQIIKLPKWDLFRFLIFKYSKLLLPFSLIIWTIYLFNFLITSSKVVIILFSIIFILLLLIKQTRAAISLVFRINYFFFVAIFKFLFYKKRSVRWDKLKIMNNSATKRS